MLVQEANSQDNCVIDYQDELVAGRCVLFRMLIPERATFEIRRDGSSWKLGQVKRSQNEPVRPETLSLVLKWFNQSMRAHWNAANPKKQHIAAKHRNRDTLTQATFELL